MSIKGQITIPKKVRDSLGIGAGDSLEFELRGDECVIRKKVLEPSGIDWDRVYGVLDFGGLTTDQIMGELRPVRAWESQ